jgi:hypothetical protein
LRQGLPKLHRLTSNLLSSCLGLPGGWRAGHYHAWLYCFNAYVGITDSCTQVLPAFELCVVESYFFHLTVSQMWTVILLNYHCYYYSLLYLLTVNL